MEKKRSWQIILIGTSVIVWGVIRLFLSLWGLRFYALGIYFLIEWIIPQSLLAQLPIAYYLINMVIIIIGGVAFLRLDRRGRFLIQIALLPDILLNTFGMISNFGAWVAFSSKLYVASIIIIILLVDITILYFISTPRIKEQFK